MPPKIQPETLRKLLLAFTTKAPFYDHNSNTYLQTNDASMRSLLGPVFSNFYMSYIVNKVFETTEKPQFYTRYVDIFVLKGSDEIINIKTNFPKTQR